MPPRAVFRPQSGLPCVLASASPRRRDLLQQIGLVPDRIDRPGVDETPSRGEIPRTYAARMADAKADDVAPRHPGAFVLAADTVVACGRRILPKALEPDEARLCLGLLSGRRHRVLGAVTLVRPDGARLRRLVATHVRFKRLSADELDIYLAAGEWRGKAGGYAIQGMAAAWVASLNGSYSNVVGLPLAEVHAMLAGSGFRYHVADPP